ncbi:MAG: tetratricopeptide repeat protein, partial [Planctomycetota bacterium]
TPAFESSLIRRESSYSTIVFDLNAGVSDPSKRVNHFRVSWTFDNLEWFETEKIAQDLLKQSYLRSPSNSRLLMALSNHLINYSKTSINEALAYATAAVASRPDDPSVLEKYVDLSLKQELSGDSDLFQRAAAMAERHGRLSGKSNAIDQMFNSYTRWARKSFRARRFDEAVAFYKTSQELQPDRFAAHIDLGMSHLRENQLNEAELAFDAGIQSAPNDAEGYTAMSSLRVQQGRYEDAETLLKKAIELEPNVSDHLRQLANCYAARENWEQCLTTYRAFMATGGSKVIGTRAMAWLLSDLGRDEEALNQFRKLVELEPSYPNRFSLALCIMQVEGKEMMWEQCDRWVDNDGDEQLLSTASALSRNALVGWYLHDLPILKETEDASRRRPPRHRLYSLTNLRAVVDWVLERDDTQRKDLLVSAAVWLEMNEFEKAIEDAERYDNAKKANFMMLNPLISNAIRASALHRLDQTEEAIAHCKKFLDSPTTIGGNFQEAINSWFREHPAMVELKEILDAREEAANSPDEE